MKIGIDLDGVVFDSENYFRTASELFDIARGGAGMVRPEELRFQSRYDWDEDTCQSFLDQYLQPIMQNCPIMPYAREVMAQLRADGHQLIAITARGGVHPLLVDWTEKRLRDENIVFDRVYFHQHSKLATCQQEQIDVMIDDLVDHVREISGAGIPCLYFRDLVKTEFDAPNVREVRNWGDIYRALGEMCRK